MVNLYKKAKSFFHLYLIYFDSKLSKFSNRRNTIYNCIKISACISILLGIFLNGFYSILFTKLAIQETTFILFVLLAFSLLFLAFSPMLIEPDPFVSLLNSRQKFYFENIHANLLSKLIIFIGMLLINNVIKLRVIEIFKSQ